MWPGRQTKHLYLFNTRWLDGILLKGINLWLVKMKCYSMWFAFIILNLLIVLCKCICHGGCASIIKPFYVRMKVCIWTNVYLRLLLLLMKVERGTWSPLKWPPPLLKLDTKTKKDPAPSWGLTVCALASFSTNFPRACFSSDGISDYYTCCHVITDVSFPRVCHVLMTTVHTKDSSCLVLQIIHSSNSHLTCCLVAYLSLALSNQLYLMLMYTWPACECSSLPVQSADTCHVVQHT